MIQNSESKIGGSRWRRWGLPGVVLILAAVAVGIALIQQRLAPPPQTAADTTRAIGPANAPVTIVEYGDFNCPTCKTWQLRGIKELILADYAGDVRFVWRDFPIITALSPKAAEAGLCANDQGEFWKYHDLLYFMAPIANEQELKDFAVQAGLDASAFNRCLAAGVHRADVQNDLQDARSHGFIGTPSFLVNGKPLIGPPTYQQLAREVEAALHTGK